MVGPTVVSPWLDATRPGPCRKAAPRGRLAPRAWGIMQCRGRDWLADRGWWQSCVVCRPELDIKDAHSTGGGAHAQQQSRWASGVAPALGTLSGPGKLQ